MLIESSELCRRLSILMKDARESAMVFSHYKVAVECIEKMKDIIEDIEAATSWASSEGCDHIADGICHTACPEQRKCVKCGWFF